MAVCKRCAKIEEQLAKRFSKREGQEMNTLLRARAKKFYRLCRDDRSWRHELPDEWLDAMSDDDAKEFIALLKELGLRHLQGGWELCE
jgi:hypothetical protein